MTEVAVEHYQITDTGRSLVNDQPLGGVVLLMSISMLSLGNMREYFRKNGFQNPCDGEQGPWQDSHNLNESFFQWLEGRPREKKAFHLAMADVQPNLVCQWFEHFHVEKKLRVEGDRISLVDVGGGMGHDTKRLLERYPGLKKRLWVLDLPCVVKDATAHPGIEYIGHNIFDPYPAKVRGAKTYYMRMVLHDWPEKQAKSILENVREAMSEDSLLLINEIVLPEKGVSMYEARMDFLMMGFCAAMERTELQWTKLLEDTGFVVRSIWMCGPMFLIETALPAIPRGPL
jgi:hypothetical protein